MLDWLDRTGLRAKMLSYLRAVSLAEHFSEKARLHEAIDGLHETRYNLQSQYERLKFFAVDYAEKHSGDYLAAVQAWEAKSSQKRIRHD